MIKPETKNLGNSGTHSPKFKKYSQIIISNVLEYSSIYLLKASEMKSKLMSIILENLKKDSTKVEIESMEPMDVPQKARQGDEIINSESESILFSFKVDFSKKV